MSSIQKIRTLELRMNDFVDDYIQKFFNEEDAFAISSRCGKIILKAVPNDIIIYGKTTELHSLKDLVRPDIDGKSEADFSRISDIANSWSFIE